MRKFKVLIQYHALRWREIEVEAEDESDAENEAYDNVGTELQNEEGDGDFSYKVTEIL